MSKGIHTFEFSAKTRDGQTAYFNRLPPCHVIHDAAKCGEKKVPLVLMGSIGGKPMYHTGIPMLEMWTAMGCYAYDSEPHPWDLLIQVK